MPRQLKIICAILALSLTCCSTYAAKKRSSIRIYQFQDAKCEDYTGTWEGFASDTSGLFGDGGPWPIMVQLYNKDGYIIGRSTEVKDVFKETEIWARCSKGKLRNIFWGKKDSCGRFTQRGILVSKNMMVLELGYQNAMNDADIMLLLTRKSKTYPYSVPKEKKDFKLDRVKTCH